jgi:Fur family zinc uptake transcriptional regulator
MDEATRKLEKIVKDNGYSVTAPRLAVLKYLLGREPVTLSMLTKEMASTVDRASVYRTINLFQELGIIQRHNVGLKYKIELSDIFAEHHHHFTCTRCGKVVAINEKALERFVDRLAGHYGFTAREHQFEVQGLCSTCKTLGTSPI